jgi:hypothetical protein
VPERPLLIDGTFELGSAEPFAILNPTTGALIDSVAAFSADQVDIAVFDNLAALLGGNRSSGNVCEPGVEGWRRSLRGGMCARGSDRKICQRGSGPTAIDARLQS